MKVKITGYSIKTCGSNISSNHLKSWVIEGKNEGEEWKGFDQQDNNDLNGSSYQYYYSIPEKTEPYQYIRIKCVGLTHYGYSHNRKQYQLTLSNVEIFGELEINE